MPIFSTGQMSDKSFLLFYCILKTASSTTPVIYSLKFVIVFNFWEFISSHSVAVTENQRNISAWCLVLGH